MWAIAGNVYKNWCKKRKRFAGCELDENVSDGGIPLAMLLEKESDIRLLHRELGLLTEQYRKVVIMYYFNDAKVSVISKSLNLTESMVKFLLFKSRKILKEGMNMERKIGDLSFNPGYLKLCVAGGSSWPVSIDPTIFERNLIAQNILLACYYEQCTAEEISLQLGIAVPYLENYINELCESGVIIKKASRYETAVVIFTKNFSVEANTKTLHLQQKAAETIAKFLDEHLIKAVGFHAGDGDDDGLMRWRITQLILEQGVLEKYEQGLSVATYGGHKLFIWGEEDLHYGCMNVTYDNARGDQMKFLEFYATSFNERVFDFGYFWKQEKRVNLIIEIAKGKHDFDENEMLEAAEFIKNGWVKKDGEKLSLCIPVYTSRQFKQIASLLDPVTDKIAEITRQIIAICTDVLMQHTPAQKKKSAKEIVWLKRHYFAMSAPVEIMQSNNTLRRVPHSEHPAAYIVLS
jgi:DNA-directed RNA polymerase specialized sigma24 family protein